MPVYEYECPECKRVFEVQQRMSDAPLSTCPECGGAVKKLISMSAFHLKGGGWYADGYTCGNSNGGKKPQNGSSQKKDNATSPPPCAQSDSSHSCCKNCPAST